MFILPKSQSILKNRYHFYDSRFFLFYLLDFVPSHGLTVLDLAPLLGQQRGVDDLEPEVLHRHPPGQQQAGDGDMSTDYTELRSTHTATCL